MNIRDNAMHCEAKKHAFRQTQDGVVVSFVLHPQEVPNELALAALGTRFMLALVEIGDDEQPKAPAKKPEKAPAEKQPQNWHDMKLSQQAGVLCNDPVFHRFMNEGVRLDSHGLGHGRAWSRPVTNTADAAEAVRYLCVVNSRADIDKGSVAAARWHEIVSQYRAWVREPEIVG